MHSESTLSCTQNVCFFKGFYFFPNNIKFVNKSVLHKWLSLLCLYNNQLHYYSITGIIVLTCTCTWCQYTKYQLQICISTSPPPKKKYTDLQPNLIFWAIKIYSKKKKRIYPTNHPNLFFSVIGNTAIILFGLIRLHICVHVGCRSTTLFCVQLRLVE